MRKHFWQELLLWLIYLACLGLLFLPGLGHSEIPAFRDGFHFYYPQAVWFERCAARGEYFPTWNPGEWLGASTAGQPSSALYYPLRVIWLMPWFSLPQRYSAYLLVHVVIAGLGMRYAAGSLRLSHSAAWLAAISFSLSCPVIFQHANAIFLCSAAWIGFSIGALVRLLNAKRTHGGSSCLVFAAACSMMFLAGDPHTAVNALVVAALVVASVAASSIKRMVIESLARKAPAKNGHQAIEVPKRGLREACWLCVACLLIAALTAIAWMPTLRWAAHSNRLAAQQIGTVQQPELARVLATPEESSHHVYDFSLSPWHLATTVWPTLAGHFIPHNSRLFAAIPSEGRMWIPSLYFGLLPCMFVLMAGGRQVRDRSCRVSLSLAGLLTLALVFSFGNYSLVWVAREGLRAIGLEQIAIQLPRDHVGSFYWMLTELIPGYSAFRYPGKWTVWIVAAASLLAAFQMHQLSNSNFQPSKRIRKSLLILSAVGLIASLAFWAATALGLAAQFDDWFADAANDRLLGSPTSIAIAHSCSIAFGLSVVILLAIPRLRSAPSICIVTAVEMTLAATQWVIFAPAPLARALDLPSENSAFVWASTATADSPLGKLSTLEYPRVLGATLSIEPVELSRLRRWLLKNDTLKPQQPALDSVLAQLGVSKRLIAVDESKGRMGNGWKSIESPAPLCELRRAEGVVAAAVDVAAEETLRWQWQSSSRLEIEAHCLAPTQLVVRQYNDGGWLAESLDGQLHLAPAVGRLFVEIDLPAGDAHFVLRRKWLW